MVHIRVLGSCTAERDGEPIPLGGHRQRSVLALLVAARGRVVSVDRMIEELWQGAPPARAISSLQAYVSNLRRLLEPGRAPRTPARLLVSTPPGYALRLPEEAVDARRFERLLGEARERLAADPDAARGLLREALALWRGPAYADSADEPWSHPEIMRLGELRLAARELGVAAGLRGPDIAGAVSEAALLTGEEPLREEAWRLHALALWAAGRQADALATLRRARAVLAEEAGLDPGPALVALERAVLTQDDTPLREALGRPGRVSGRGAACPDADPPPGTPGARGPGTSGGGAGARAAERTGPDPDRQAAGPADLGRSGSRGPGHAGASAAGGGRAGELAGSGVPESAVGVGAAQLRPGNGSRAAGEPGVAGAAGAGGVGAAGVGGSEPVGGDGLGGSEPVAEGDLGGWEPAGGANLGGWGPIGREPVGGGGLGGRELVGRGGLGGGELGGLEPASREPGGEGDLGGSEPGGGVLFVGREGELARLGGVARGALGGGPAVALVTGEAGLGKSALLHRFGARLRADGWLVAVGRTTDAEGAPPAWPWVEALRTVAGAVPPGPGAAAVLAPLLGEAEPAPRPPGGDVAAGRFRLHRAVWRWLAEAARQRPVAIVLDDLHWADHETLALLAGVADLPSGTALLVVGAYRPDEVEGRLGDTLAGLARRSPLRIALPGLPEAAVAEVVRAVGGPRVDRDTLAALAERTGGNPFYVRESARLLGSEGSLVALSEVPEGVRDVLRRRLGRLPDAAVSVLRLAAVAGRESWVDVLVEAADADEDAVLAALEAGLLAGLLVEPGPGRIRFAHALVRDTLLADLSRLRSARMYGRIAQCLERLGPDEVSLLAHHYTRAASAATAAKAVEYCLRAADLAEARYAHEVAAALLADAVTSADRIPAGPGDREAERAGLLGRLLRAQVRAGAVMAARATRSTAIGRAVEAGREDLLVRAFTAWDEPTPWQTRPYGAVDEPVVALLDGLLAGSGPDPAVRCRLLGAYAAELSDARIPAVRAAAREALDLAGGLGDPVLRAGALATLVKELDADREWPERAALGAELERLGAAHDLPAHRWYGMFVRSTALAAEGDVPGARRLVERWSGWAETYRMPGPMAVAETAAATLAHIAGRTEEAERLYRQSSERMARQGSPHAEGHLVIATATLRASQGRLAEALPWARRVYAGYGPLAGDLLAVSLAAAGEGREAREVLAAAGELRTDYLFKVFATFRATTLVTLGERRGAGELYEALLPYRDAPPPSSGFTVAVRPVARTLGELARLLGRDAEAAGHFARAGEIAARWSSPL
ncbi:BTAD domain-containing putative transcriptional regulator [Streptomyces lavendulae]|uniref:BTAD domain-containing putative transcriptional regulator n=1 Tax=Streptomyces lavendulae TaxID=1914 RepID=UPI0036864832